MVQALASSEVGFVVLEAATLRGGMAMVGLGMGIDGGLDRSRLMDGMG